MLAASTPGAPSLARTLSHASTMRRLGMSNDFTFSFGPPVGSFPCGLASWRPDLPGSLGSSPITGPSSLLRAGPPLCLPVLGLLRFLPLEGLPLATGGARFTHLDRTAVRRPQVLPFHASACDELTPPLHRAPPGRRAGMP